MLYLLDANVLITASNTYYPIDQVPEFWEWLLHNGEVGKVKIPIEIMEEILEGRDNDPLLGWIKKCGAKKALLLEEEVDPTLVQCVMNNGYAPDLTDVEVDQVGHDPFLIAYAMAQPADRSIITTEVSKPKKIRQNRRVPDVCNTLSIRWHDPFYFNRSLGFRTSWKNPT